MDADVDLPGNRLPIYGVFRGRIAAGKFALSASREEGIVVRASMILALLAAIALLGRSAIAQGTPTSAAEIPANLAPPADSVMLFELRGRGVQIYTCAATPDDATSFVWTFKAPEAELLNDRGEVVGRHFAGPTWQGWDGSAVTGAVLERADAPDAGAIPWLLLEAQTYEGSGVFSTITYIQRLDTVGGVAPAAGCDLTHADEQVRTSYEATYAFFYPAVSATASVATPTTQTGSVTIRVFSCPAELSGTAGQWQIDEAVLLAGCTPLADPESAPTLRTLPDDEPQAGTTTEPGVYRWQDLALGNYAVGGSVEESADMVSLLVVDAASGAALQNPALSLGETSPRVEYHYYYFLAAATPAADATS
jgi:hypothetical protein